MMCAILSLGCGPFVFGDAQEWARGLNALMMYAFHLCLCTPYSCQLLSFRFGFLLRGAFPCMHFLWCWSTHSSSNFLLAALCYCFDACTSNFPCFHWLFMLFCCVWWFFANLAKQWLHNHRAVSEVRKNNLSSRSFVCQRCLCVICVSACCLYVSSGCQLALFVSFVCQRAVCLSFVCQRAVCVCHFGVRKLFLCLLCVSALCVWQRSVCVICVSAPSVFVICGSALRLCVVYVSTLCVSFVCQLCVSLLCQRAVCVSHLFVSNLWFNKGDKEGLLFSSIGRQRLLLGLGGMHQNLMTLT